MAVITQLSRYFQLLFQFLIIIYYSYYYEISYTRYNKKEKKSKQTIFLLIYSNEVLPEYCDGRVQQVSKSVVGSGRHSGGLPPATLPPTQLVGSLFLRVLTLSATIRLLIEKSYVEEIKLCQLIDCSWFLLLQHSLISKATSFSVTVKMVAS